MELIEFKKRGRCVELNFLRREETQEAFYKTLVALADLLGGEAAWQGASKELAHIIIRKVEP